MPWICKKSALVLALFECINGLNFHLKCSFKGILEKKHQFFFPLGPFFLYSYMECLSKCSYSKKPSLSWKILGCAPDICSTCNIALLTYVFKKTLVHGKVEGLTIKILIHNEVFHKKIIFDTICAFLYDFLYSRSKFSFYIIYIMSHKS